MKRKDYQKPYTNIVYIQHTGIICASDQNRVTNVNSEDTDLGYGGGGNGVARGRQNNVCDDEEDWNE